MSHSFQTDMPSLSIVMPYYNEELNVATSITSALQYLRGRWRDFEIVAVDDHSTDRTLELLHKMQADEPRIQVVALTANTKFAGALKRGFAVASKQYVFYTDGDCPIDFSDIDKAMTLLDRFDVVVGYRTSRDAEGFVRRLYTWGYRMFLRFLLGLRFRDVNFSFKLFPKRALDAISIESKGSFIDAELLFKLREAGFSIGETPIRYYSRRKGKSTLASPLIVLRIWREAWAFARSRSSRYPIPRKEPSPEETHSSNR